MTKKMEIWKVDKGEVDVQYLIDPKEVVEKIEIGGSSLVIDGISDLSYGEELDLSNQLERFKNEMEEKEEYFNADEPEDLKKFLEVCGYENIEVDYADDYLDFVHENENRLVYDGMNKVFFSLTDFEPCEVYEWWNGSNYETLKHAYYDEGVIKTEIEITEDSVDLGEWDGRNWTTGGLGHHQNVYKVKSVDGEKVEDQYLLEESSQWQGDHTLGQVMSEYELINHLQELGRDVEEYMSAIKSLDLNEGFTKEKNSEQELER
ncbi:hypothetical protein ACFSCZ_00605 [Siminovitchia sediminis]|uniref:Uncharacterized protein n=1 Tax=Siminovitchia sediminis TaxID=1274353 RepID=A0ABW4KD63_9BACI